MKKTFLTSLTLVSVIIASMLAFEANSQTFTFEITDFTIVNRTLPRQSSQTPPCLSPAGGSLWYGQITDSSVYPYRTFNGYILTDTFGYQSSAFWHNVSLDLSKDFVFQCRMNFGDTTSRYGYNGGDGICFVLHQENPVDGLIGNDKDYIGYGWHNTPSSPPQNLLQQGSDTLGGGDTLQGGPSPITPSFAIEFDSYNDNKGERDYYYGEHISYLKNGNSHSNDGNSAPIRPNGYTIKDTTWHCITIFWQKVDSGYVMNTYVGEDLRMSKYYGNISNLISSASETNSLVRWGITSATGGAINRQMIEFVSMENSDTLFNTAIIHIENVEPIRYAFGGSSLVTACGVISLPNTQPDTIYYPYTLCVMGNPITITLSDTTGAEWAVLKGSNYDSIPSGFIDISNLGLSNYATIKVRLVLNGDTTYFVFQKGVTPLNNYFKDNGSSLGFTEPDGTKKIDTTYQSIALPANLLSCIVIGNYDTNRYVTPPHITNGKLEFELFMDTFCVLTSITLRNTCDTLCDMDKVSLGFSGFCPCDSVSYYFVADPPIPRPLLPTSYKGTIWVKSTSGIGISRIEWNEIGGNVSSISFSGEDSAGVRISLPCTGKDSVVYYKVCATLENGTHCCGYVNVAYKCYSYRYIDPDWTNVELQVDSRINITAVLLQFPVPAEPLRISICSQSGDEVMLVSNSIPTELVSYFSPSVANLVVGMYYVVFQIAGETYSIPFIKQ